MRRARCWEESRMDVGVRGRGGAEEWSNGGRGPGWDQGAREGEDQGLRTEEEPREGDGRTGEGRGKDEDEGEDDTPSPRVWLPCPIGAARARMRAWVRVQCSRERALRSAAGVRGRRVGSARRLLSDRKWKREWKWKWKKRKRDDRR